MAHQEPAEVSMLLTSIPPGTAGGEHLIFTALERGPAEIRVCAIEQFGKFPTPEVINALIDIVNLNNNHPEPVLAEVEAACLALARMQVEAATAFVDRVIRARSGLLHVYRKPIRKAMARMAAQERKS
jgi:hypothetical protein